MNINVNQSSRHKRLDKNNFSKIYLTLAVTCKNHVDQGHKD